MGRETLTWAFAVVGLLIAAAFIALWWLDRRRSEVIQDDPERLNTEPTTEPTTVERGISGHRGSGPA